MERWWKEGSREARVLEWILRVGVAGCFIGHGAFGIIGKEGWLPYFAVFGIPESWAWPLMPVVGSVDILVGIVALLSPRPAILAYAAGWALLTALLRPLAGESVFETLERAGNYGIPLAFLLAAGVGLRGRLGSWFRPARVLPLTGERRRRVAWALRGTLALLLVGHGGLALQGKALLAGHLAVAGVDPSLLGAVGGLEIALGLWVALRPRPGLLLFVLGWKVGTEALFPLAGAPMWEFVERAGSYAAPLALLVVTPVPSRRAGRRRSGPAGAAWRAAAGVVVAAVALVTASGLQGGTGPAGSPAVPGDAPSGGERSARRSAGVATDGILRGLPVGADLRHGDALAADTTLLGELRAGGLVLACRHAVTDRSRSDRRPVDYDDPGTQRILSESGREQARALGRVLRELEVPIGEVFTSPYDRTENTALLAFGAATRTRALVYGNSREQRRGRRRLLSAVPDEGNRVLMTHQGILYSTLPTVERGSIREGDCVVVRPLGDRYEALARLGPEDFGALADVHGSASGGWAR